MPTSKKVSGKSKSASSARSAKGGGKSARAIDTGGPVPPYGVAIKEALARGDVQERTADDLWGFCRGCYYAEVCRAGCTWTSDSLLGRAGNNPYCHHRALELARQGLRERIVQVEQAPGRSFDHGLFALILETSDGRPHPPPHDAPRTAESPPAHSADPLVNPLPLSGNSLVQIRSARKQRAGESAKKKGRPTLADLVLCRGCDRHVMSDADTCPHCGGNVEALARAYEKRLREARRASRRLMKLLRLS